MKDLHIKLDDVSEICLNNLCKYCNCTQTEIIETLLIIGNTAAFTQHTLGENKPKSHMDEYYITVITDIFDHLYPTVEEL